MDYWLLVKALGFLALIIMVILLLGKGAAVHLAKGKRLFYGAAPRLKIIDRQAIDGKRSLIRFQDDHHSYLVLLGTQTEHVLHKQAHPTENLHAPSV